VFLVAWTGGLEQPSFAAFDSDEDAMNKARLWADQMGEPGDRVDVLCVHEAPGGEVIGNMLPIEGGKYPIEVIATFAYQGA
jgi:hypothetical protein